MTPIATPPLRVSWVVWGLGALLYLMGFFQRVAPAVMTDELMGDFGISAAGPIEENADLVVEMFNRLMEYTKCSVPGTLVIPFATTPDAMGEEIKVQAVKFAHKFM
jgi:hypothetical protein